MKKTLPRHVVPNYLQAMVKRQKQILQRNKYKNDNRLFVANNTNQKTVEQYRWRTEIK